MIEVLVALKPQFCAMCDVSVVRLPRGCQGLNHAHPMRSPKLWAARHDARAARLFSWSAIKAVLGLSTSAEERGERMPFALSSSAMRSHIIFALLMAALGTYVGKSRVGTSGTRSLLGLLAVLGAGGAGFVLGATATLERLQLGRL